MSSRAGRVAVAAFGDGAPIVLLHSNGHDRHDFDAIVPALARRFRVLAVDWPGMGDSDAPTPPSSASVALVCDVLEDVVDDLGLRSAIFMGNSVGGRASIRLAARHPERVRALVLVDTAGFTPRTPLVRALCWLQGRESVRRAMATRFAAWYMKSRNEQVHRVLARIAAARDRPSHVAVDAALWRSFTRPESDASDEARSVRCPTLLVWGRRDPMLRRGVDAKRARELISGVRYIELDTGHVPFVEDPAGFLRGVMPFLDALPPIDATRGEA